MANKTQLLEEAHSLGLDVTEENTKAQIEEAIKAHNSEVEEAPAADEVNDAEQEPTGAELDGTAELEEEQSPLDSRKSAVQAGKEAARVNAEAEAVENQ